MSALADDPSDEDEFAAPVPGNGRARTKKAPNAFRTISEVADELHIPQHVLRFWETKFPQVKPLKRGGGRRYYRPEDIGLLRRVSDLLYTQGYTIKGVQRLLRDGGGRLADEIPPPTPDEQQEAAAERAGTPAPSREPELPIPGLVPATPAPMPVARTVLRQKIDPETERLRAVLRATLRELEELRALLS
jgi:DNA-binding transcriptional MerR regulator